MKDLRALSLVVLSVLALGCGDGNQQPEKLSRTNDPSRIEKRYEPVVDDSVLTAFPTYPGAEYVTREREVGDTISPDEKRYHLILSTADDLEKVRKFYEERLQTSAAADGDVLQLINRTERGDDIIVKLQTKDSRTVIEMNIISYDRPRG